MDRKTAILKAFQDAPEAWTAGQLETLQQRTGEKITREALREAFTIDNSRLYYHLSAAVAEALETVRGLDFDGRLNLLMLEILPALEALEALRDRVKNLTETDRTGGP